MVPAAYVFLMIIFPMIFVLYFMTVTYNSLVTPPSVSCILGPVNVVVYPGCALIYHNFIAMIYIVVTIPRRQRNRVYPDIVIKINILMCINVVIGINIGHVVIIGMIVANRPPVRLAAYVKAHTQVYLCYGWFE
jgi:hypothetical protein